MKSDLKQALEVLKSGGLILYPTDTIWGIGCDCTNREAIARVYDLKRREDHKSMLLLADSPEMIAQYVEEIPSMAYELIEVSVHPLTIIYPGATNLPDNLVASDGSIGIRIPSDPFCSELISLFGKPIVSTSANISGHPPPARFAEVSAEVISGVDYVVEWRQTETQPSKPSGIIKMEADGSIKVIR